MKIILNGAMGRMGKAIAALCEKKYKDVEVIKVDVIEADGVFNLNQIKNKADIIIDFSSPQGTKEILEFAFNRKIPIVIGTTGIKQEIFGLMKKYSKTIPIFYSPNMSIGVNLCFYIVDVVSKKIKSDIHIHETHHTAKKDAPSGTAVMFGEIIKNNGGSVNITSARIGDITGEHEITFALNGEKITISHTAYTREIFADGALVCAKWLLDKNSGFYNFKNLLGLDF